MATPSPPSTCSFWAWRHRHERPCPTSPTNGPRGGRLRFDPFPLLRRPSKGRHGCDPLVQARTCRRGRKTRRVKTLTVVWTPAVPEDLPLLKHFQRVGITPSNGRPSWANSQTANPTLAVAGTHGKTTTSSWLTAMLDASEDGCHAFLGGITPTPGTNHMTRPEAKMARRRGRRI